jgi:hypothetical protein
MCETIQRYRLGRRIFVQGVGLVHRVGHDAPLLMFALRSLFGANTAE